MKKIIALLLAFLSLLLVFSACGEKEEPKEKVCRISLEDKEISLTKSSLSEVYVSPIGAFSSACLEWNLSRNEVYDLIFELLSDPNAEICKFKKTDKNQDREKLISRLWAPYIFFVFQPLKGAQKAVFVVYMVREDKKIYIRYSIVEDDQTISNMTHYCMDAPWIEDIFQKYYDGRVFDPLASYTETDNS